MGRIYGGPGQADPADRLGHRFPDPSARGYGRRVDRLDAILRLRARLSRLDVPALRAMLWSARALRRTRRALAMHGLDGLRVTPAPPALPAHAVRGARFALRRMNASCLEGALVLQAWDAARGAGPDVVIGVIGTGEDFRAHAWLATAPDAAPGTFSEILRIPASRA